MSEQMYLSGIRPMTTGSFRDWDPYQRHQFMWAFFSDHGQRKRDFIFRYDRDGGQPKFIALSTRPPGQVPGWLSEYKPFAPALTEGSELRFSLRVNPIVTRPNQTTGKNSRHDVVMAFKKSNPNWADDLTESELSHRQGLAWLASRAEKHGFTFRPDGVRVEGCVYWGILG